MSPDEARVCLIHARHGDSEVGARILAHLTPFPRVGPPKAFDGEPAFDLDQWNPEFFDRLHAFITAASEREVVVECTLFSNSYRDQIWRLNPFHPRNNVNGLPEIEFQNYRSMRSPELFDHQLRYTTKIVEELNGYDNVYFEICNEPGAFAEPSATCAEVDAWQAAIRDQIRKVEAELPNRHLVFGQQAWDFAYKSENLFPIRQLHDRSYDGLELDAVNVHPLPNTGFERRLWDLGSFMDKRLQLDDLCNFAAEVAKQSVPTCFDEDNAATLYRDEEAWTIHRKRAWVAMLSGTHYDMIDFSIIPGSAPARNRRWARAPRRDVIVYLADHREISETGAGDPISGTLKIDVPDGRHSIRAYGPTTGEWSPGLPTTVAAGAVEVALGEFRHDRVVRLTRLGE